MLRRDASLVIVTFAICLPIRLLAAAPTEPAPATMQFSTTAPAQAMPQETLDKIDRAELAGLYKASQQRAYFETHKLIEQYFEAKSSQRKDLTLRIAAQGLDANIVGRLLRVHINWPELTAGSHLIDVHIGPNHVVYYFGVPARYDRTVKWPLVVSLPSYTPFLADPKPDAAAIAKLYTGWIRYELSKHPDALVLMPILDPEEGFGPSYVGMNSVIGALNHAMSQANIDPARVYLTGQDGAASAVWNLGLHYTTYFAAINPFGGSIPADWQRLRFENLINTAVVTWNDLDNKDPNFASTQDVAGILKRLKCDVTFLRGQHTAGTPQPAIVEQAYEAMRTHGRKLYPTTVDIASSQPDTMFNRLDWVQMYQATRPGHEQHLLFHHAGFMLLDEHSMSIRASIANNKITAVTDNVESMRFYLNDQMIDFTKPVMMNVNTRERFGRIVKPNLDEMLRDQLFVGRGWRYYTVVLDVDFAEPATKPTTLPHKSD